MSKILFFSEFPGMISECFRNFIRSSPQLDPQNPILTWLFVFLLPISRFIFLFIQQQQQQLSPFLALFCWFHTSWFFLLLHDETSTVKFLSLFAICVKTPPFLNKLNFFLVVWTESWMMIKKMLMKTSSSWNYNNLSNG